jgi:hypothetical protein
MNIVLRKRGDPAQLPATMIVFMDPAFAGMTRGIPRILGGARRRSLPDQVCG